MAVKDIFSGGVILLFCLIGFMSTSTLDAGSDHVLYGPAFFPNLLMAVLAAGALILIVKGIFSKVPQADKPPLKERIQVKIIARIILFWLLIALYIVVFNHTGFIVSTMLFLIPAQLLYGRRRYGHIIWVSSLGTAGTYLVLAKLFDVPLPSIFLG